MCLESIVIENYPILKGSAISSPSTESDPATDTNYASVGNLVFSSLVEPVIPSTQNLPVC